jgi:GMP synthase (glutamine-hydrolysing)
MHLIVVDMGVPGHIIHRKYGLFSQWFERAYKNIDADVLVDGFTVDDVDLEDLLECDGVILTGAEENVGDQLPAHLEFREKLQAMIDHRQPLLGVCFSHQYIADHLGGEVERDLAHRQFGNVVVSLTGQGASDPLFADIPGESFFLQSP